jgi:hypothetical protein
VAAFVQVGSNTVGTGTGAGAVGNTVTLTGTVAGNLLVAAYSTSQFQNTPAGQANQVNQSFVRLVESTQYGTVIAGVASATGLWILPNCPGGTIAVTMSSVDGLAQDSCLAVLEYSGVVAPDGVPTGFVYADLNNGYVSSPVQLARATGDLFLGVFGDFGHGVNVVVAGGLTQRFNNGASAVADLVVGDILSTTTTAQAAWFLLSSASTDQYQILAASLSNTPLRPTWPITVAAG